MVVVENELFSNIKTDCYVLLVLHLHRARRNMRKRGCAALVSTNVCNKEQRLHVCGEQTQTKKGLKW